MSVSIFLSFHVSFIFKIIIGVIIILIFFSKQTHAQGMMLNMAMWQQSVPMCSPITFGPDFHINGPVHAIKVVGNIAYIGGNFTEVQGQLRDRVAAVDIITGLVSGFNPRLNGPVRSLEYDMGLLFVGGEFTSTQDFYNSHGGGIVSSMGVFNTSSPSIHGDGVYVSIPDGAGGWYIGGNIGVVGGEARDHIARINSDGSVHTFNVGAVDGHINDMHLDSVNGVLYVAGNFTNIGGQARNYIAAIEVGTGLVMAWDPNASDQVLAIELLGSTLYAAGHFTSIGGQSRNYIAALDTTVNINNATAWNPGSNGYIFGMAAGGTTVYVAGWFDYVGGANIARIAALDTTVNTNNALNWDPQVGYLTSGYGDQLVRSMILDGTTLYVGGWFADIGGQMRNSLAALDTTVVGTGMATAWSPDIQFNSSIGSVNTMSLSGSTLYIGGKFDHVGGFSRSHVAAVDTTVNTNNATAWAPSVAMHDPVHNPYNFIHGMSVSGSNIFIGAGLESMGGLPRQGLVAIDTTIDTNNVTAWNPKVDRWVNKMIMFGTTLYIGGNFQEVDGTARLGVAALDTTVNVGMLKPWDADMTIGDEGITDMILDGTIMYLAGNFTKINGQTRNRIGAVSTSADTGNVTGWNPNATGGYVRAMALSGTTMYVGGSFSNVGGQSRNRIAALDTTINTNNATSWNPSANGLINTLVTRGSTVYAGGEFTNIGGSSRQRLAGLNMSVNTNNAIAWNPNADDTVNTIKIHNNTLLAGGWFWGMNNNWDRQQFSTMCVPP